MFPEFLDVVTPLKSSLVAFASTWLSGVGTFMMSGGYSLSLESQSRTCHHSLQMLTFPPLLARAAGFWFVGTWHQVISGCPSIFFTLLAINCLFSPPPFNQWGTTELLSNPYVSFIQNPSGAFCTLVRRFAKCAETSSRHSMVCPCFASQALAFTNSLLTPYVHICLITACTVVETLLLLASPKVWSSISSICYHSSVQALDKVTSHGNSFFHHEHWLPRPCLHCTQWQDKPHTLCSHWLATVDPHGCKLMCCISVLTSGTWSHCCIQWCGFRCSAMKAHSILHKYYTVVVSSFLSTWSLMSSKKTHVLVFVFRDWGKNWFQGSLLSLDAPPYLQGLYEMR